MSATNAKPRPQSESPTAAKTAKLFKNGRSQAVRLPREFNFQGSEVSIRRDIDTGEVILSAKAGDELEPWQSRFAVWDSLGAPNEDELEREQESPVERDFF